MSRRPAILFIDDDRDALDFYAASFATCGFDIRLTQESSDGLRQILRGEIDLVVTDLRMPWADGELLIQVIREHNKTLPIIVVSGFVTFEQVQLGMKDVFRILQKPVHMATLEDVIEDALEIYLSQRRDATIPAYILEDERLNARSPLGLGGY